MSYFINFRKMTKEDMDCNTVAEKSAGKYDAGRLPEVKVSVWTYILCAIGLLVFTAFSTLTLYDAALAYKLIPAGSWFILFLLGFFVMILGLVCEYAIASLYLAVAKTNQKIEDNIEEVKEEITGVRTELKGGITGVRTELKGDIAGVREEITGVRTELKGDIAGVRTELDVVVKTLKLMLLNKKGAAMQVLIAAEHSPLDMTALGRETLEESGIKKYVDGRWEEWSQQLHAFNLSKKHTGDLYKIQEEIFSFVEANISEKEDLASMIEEIGSLTNLRFLARLYARNKFFKENNWVIKEIDKYNPSKNKSAEE